MASLYVHFPFCEKACAYCDFYFTLSKTLLPAFIASLKKEIVLRARQHYFKAEDPISSIYFGGGTPSLLSLKELGAVLDAIRKNFAAQLGEVVECTLEANPRDFSLEKAKGLRALGVNRISLGVQAFQEAQLAYLGRAQSTADVFKAVSALQTAGFTNYSFDLIYGMPTLTQEHFLHNLSLSLQLGAKHLSLYCLTVEKGTPLWREINKHEKPSPQEAQEISHFKAGVSFLEEKGFFGYEISNFAEKTGEKKGLPFSNYFSKHNCSYWRGSKYLGLGPAAHSFDGVKKRRRNLPNLKRYLAAFDGKRETVTETDFSSAEELSKETVFNEYVLSALRTIWGCELNVIEKRFGRANAERLLKKAAPLIEKEKLLRLTTCGIGGKKISRLTLRGNNAKLLADKIALQLL